MKQNEANEVRTLKEQFTELKKKHPDAVIMFRGNDWYHFIGDDAKTASEVLGITLTRRTSDNEPTACFPCHALDTYLPRFIRAGKRVAICDDIVERKTIPNRSVSSERTTSEEPFSR